MKRYAIRRKWYDGTISDSKFYRTLGGLKSALTDYKRWHDGSLEYVVSIVEFDFAPVKETPIDEFYPNLLEGIK